MDGLGKGRLDADDRRHLLTVLRLRAGETVSVVDGRGWRQACTLGAGGELEPAGEPGWEPPGQPAVTVALAVPKGDRAEWAVQKLTEIGVDRVVLVAAERSVVRWHGERAGRHRQRLRSVARAAACQSRRAWLPLIDGPVTLSELAARAGPTAGGGAGQDRAGQDRAGQDSAGQDGVGPVGPLALAEPGGGPPSLAQPTLVIGPEGGWSPDELALGLPRVALGPTVLRTETAAVTAGALLVALRAGLVSPTLQT